MDENYKAVFEEKGYVVFRGLFSARATIIKDEVDKMQGWKETPGAYQMYFERSLKDDSRILSRIEKFLEYNNTLAEVINDGELLNILNPLLGGNAKLFKEKVNYKQPGGDGFKHHQDQAAGWSKYDDFFVTALICVDEANKNNGTLEIIAHTEKSRAVTNTDWAPLAQDDIDSMVFEVVDLLPGDVIIFDSYVFHGSYPNLTDTQRRVIYATYGDGSKGDFRSDYYADKAKSYPQDCERDPTKEYIFKV